MQNNINIRETNERDHSFIFGLSSTLAEVAQLEWHDDAVVQKMQDNYISKMLAKASEPNITFIAEIDQKPMGFIHVRTHKDSISDETCGTIPLLAVCPESQGLGIGKALLQIAENWAKDLGCRLLHLEVFANNTNAKGFYKNVGFLPETLHMVKPIK
ncbi:MAG: GNAT family N-acetyltransferase [Flavicella sp.]